MEEQNPYRPPEPPQWGPPAGYDPHAPPADYLEAKALANLKILGWVQVGFGAFGIIGTLASRAMVGALDTQGVNRELNRVMYTGVVGTWMEVAKWLGAATALVLLCAGLQVLKRRPLGRTLSLVHAGLAATLVVVGLFMNFVYVFPALSALAETGGPIAKAGARGGMMGGVMGALFGLVLPGFEWSMMRKPEVRRVLGDVPAGDR